MARIEILEHFHDDPRLSAEWNDLFTSSARPNVFLSWEWLTTWWDAFGRSQPLHLALVREGADLIGAAPWYVARSGIIPRGAVRQLRFVGDGGPTCPEYLGPIVREGHLNPVTDALADHLACRVCRWDCLRLSDVAPDDDATVRLARILASRFPTVGSPGAVCPYLPLPATYDDFLMSLSGHGRQRERRLLRGARKQFDVRLEVIDDPAQLGLAFDDVIRLHTSARSRKDEPSPFAQRDYAEFHRAIMKRFLANGWLQLSFLRLDGARAAFQYGFLHRGRYYDFQNGFDAAFQKHNPGDVLLQLVFAAVIEAGAREFDFLRGEHAYKRKFARQVRETRTLLVTRRRGLVYAAAAARELLARCRRRARGGGEAATGHDVSRPNGAMAHGQAETAPARREAGHSTTQSHDHQ
jgi:CelD/BcsL family acetyltransferase involved in cellulose biosynthesis